MASQPPTPSGAFFGLCTDGSVMGSYSTAMLLNLGAIAADFQTDLRASLYVCPSLRKLL
jgi:hypothetical protein